MKENQTQIDTASEALFSKSAESTRLESVAEELDKVLPLVGAARENAGQALSLLPEDTELKAISEGLNRRHASLVARMENVDKKIQDSRQAVGSVRNQIEQWRAAGAKFSNELKVQKQKLEEARKEAEPLRSQLAEVTKERKTLRQNAESTERTMSRWKDELKFDRALNRHLEALAAARRARDLREAEFQGVSEKLQHVQAEFDERNRAKSQSEADVKKMEAELKQLRTRN